MTPLGDRCDRTDLIGGFLNEDVTMAPLFHLNFVSRACHHAANINQVSPCWTDIRTDLQQRATFPWPFPFQVTCTRTFVHEKHKASGRFLFATASGKVISVGEGSASGRQIPQRQQIMCSSEPTRNTRKRSNLLEVKVFFSDTHLVTPLGDRCDRTHLIGGFLNEDVTMAPLFHQSLSSCR